MSGMDKNLGIVFHWPRAYDLLLRLVWGQKEDCYRAHVLQLAELTRGESVLDVGCGTGTLAIAAKRLVGPEGQIVGLDTSPEMIARAKAKAARSNVAIQFVKGTAQDLPFADSSFDAVLSTTLIHCLPEADRSRCYRDMARVLKPGGRLLIVDFGGSAASKHSLFGHMHAHRRFELENERSRLADAAFRELETGPTGFPDLHYIRAKRAIVHGKLTDGGLMNRRTWRKSNKVD